MVSHPETGSDSPIGSDRESGRDTLSDTKMEILESSGHLTCGYVRLLLKN